VEQLKQNQQDNLRKINVLFDENAVDYETINFNGLYSLLEKVAERERERESKKVMVEEIKKADGSKKKKKKK